MNRTLQLGMIVALALGLLAIGPLEAHARGSKAVTIFATGQLLTPGDLDNPDDDIRENFYYAIDPTTGIATPVSPALTEFPPAALAGDGPSRLLGFDDGQLVEIEPTTGAQTPIGANNGLASTGRFPEPERAPEAGERSAEVAFEELGMSHTAQIPCQHLRVSAALGVRDVRIQQLQPLPNVAGVVVDQ